MMAFRRPKNLEDYLVHARIKPDNNSVIQGSHRYSSTRCERQAFLTLGIRLLVIQLENRTALIIILIVAVAMLSIYSVVRLVGSSM